MSYNHHSNNNIVSVHLLVYCIIITTIFLPTTTLALDHGLISKNKTQSSSSSSPPACTYIQQQGVCGVGCKCFEFIIISARPSKVADAYDVTFSVKNNCGFPVSYVAIGTGGLKRIYPERKAIYHGQGGGGGGGMKHDVEWCAAGKGSPTGFEGILFKNIDISYHDGKSEIYTVTLGGAKSNYIYSFQGHAGATWETFTGISIENCLCNCSSSPCPKGWAGPNCDQCAKVMDHRWMCQPTSNELDPFHLVLVPSPSLESLQEQGYFPADSKKKDSDGFVYQCDCKLKEQTCPNNCTGHGQCNRNTGECFCWPPASGADCSEGIDKTKIDICKKHQYCSGNGLCTNKGTCQCIDDYLPPSCSSHNQVISSCGDIDTCHACAHYSINSPSPSKTTTTTTTTSSSCVWCGGECVNGVSCFGGKSKAFTCTPDYLVFIPEKCPDECTGHGTCKEDKCECDEGWGEINCGVPSREDINNNHPSLLRPSSSSDVLIVPSIYSHFLQL
eukprot:TRINITY_DN1168_c1_g1_i2.p1 TRINITY_DN1168_c1_g1~~TRINITY_DN1168_c1_g1_i2.p1  ORF type:complete len:542 (-),score=126.93 TRINITY_DN1168_c1_g1_i2:139-1641(-)